MGDEERTIKACRPLFLVFFAPESMAFRQSTTARQPRAQAVGLRTPGVWIVGIVDVHPY